MNKQLLLLFLLLLAGALYFSTRNINNNIARRSTASLNPPAEKALLLELKKRTLGIGKLLRNKKLSDQYCFLIDMSRPSGRNRFFVYNLKKDSILFSGLVAHGSCNQRFLQQAAFSNVLNSGCSSMGRYKVGYAYNGRFGKAYKLMGLDATNSNAFTRAVVLHAYECVPDSEVFPEPICNSLGCPMVSPAFLARLEPLIEQSKKPVLLWIYD